MMAKESSRQFSLSYSPPNLIPQGHSQLCSRSPSVVTRASLPQSPVVYADPGGSHGFTPSGEHTENPPFVANAQSKPRG